MEIIELTYRKPKKEYHPKDRLAAEIEDYMVAYEAFITKIKTQAFAPDGPSYFDKIKWKSSN